MVEWVRLVCFIDNSSWVFDPHVLQRLLHSYALAGIGIEHAADEVFGAAADSSPDGAVEAQRICLYVHPSKHSPDPTYTSKKLIRTIDSTDTKDSTCSPNGFNDMRYTPPV